MKTEIFLAVVLIFTELPVYAFGEYILLNQNNAKYKDSLEHKMGKDASKFNKTMTKKKKFRKPVHRRIKKVRYRKHIRR